MREVGEVKTKQPFAICIHYPIHLFGVVFPDVLVDAKFIYTMLHVLLSLTSSAFASAEMYTETCCVDAFCLIYKAETSLQYRPKSMSLRSSFVSEVDILIRFMYFTH